jgi:eukaryotic-like serine/threonine-protein kinase
LKVEMSLLTAHDAPSARVALEITSDAGIDSSYEARDFLAFHKARARLLTGDVDAAISDFSEISHRCSLELGPFFPMRSSVLLGEALEKKGDTVGACAAYQVVLDRWGKSTPPSVTASKAAERSKALACASSARSPTSAVSSTKPVVKRAPSAPSAAAAKPATSDPLSDQN